MADVFTRAKRSEVMAAIRAKDTKPEIAVRRALHAMGCRFRLHVAVLPGRPDIVLKKLGLIVQVKGCFWHGHHCLKGRVPGLHRRYWLGKIAGNKARDARNERKLRAMGWRVKTIWECRVRSSSPEELAAHIEKMVGRTRTPRGRPSERARGSYSCSRVRV